MRRFFLIVIATATLTAGCYCSMPPSQTSQLDEIRSQLVSAAASTQDRSTEEQIARAVEQLDTVRNSEHGTERERSRKGGLASFVTGQGQP